VFYRAQQAAAFNSSLQEYFDKALNGKWNDLTGPIQVQILIDTSGRPCCMKIDGNHSGVSSQDIKAAVNQMTGWSPARENNHAVCFAAQLELNVAGSVLAVRYLNEKQLMAQPVVNRNTSNTPDIIKDRKSKAIWKLWNFDNSLIPGNLSRNVAVDSRGIIWCCTDHGIVKITDNDHWQVFNGMNEPVLAGKNNTTWTTGMAVDNSDNVWVISFNNVARYDGKHWMKYDSGNSPLKSVSKMYVDKDGVRWFCGYHSLIQFDGKDWKKYSLPDASLLFNVNSLYLDGHETLWLATDKGLCKVADDKIHMFNTANNGIPEENITAVKGDNKGNIWAGAGTGDKSYLLKIDSLGNVSTFSSGVIWNITIDNAGKVWLATHGRGLVCFDGNEFTQYDKTNSIVPGTATDIAIDQNGDKWISTFGGLVFTNKK
jgi:ligand-binding sensor domain-containing protein